MWQHRGRRYLRPSHIRIIRSTGAFGRNPRDVLIRVLGIAGFAVDAILRVDDEFGGTRPLDPFMSRKPRCNLAGAVTETVGTPGPRRWIAGSRIGSCHGHAYHDAIG